MPPDIQIVPATCGHVMAMAQRLRAEDAAELEAVGVTANRVLWRSWRRSSFAKTALVDGEIACMWGLDTGGLSHGRPWFLTTPQVERAPIAMVRHGRAEVALMLSICPRLSGFVDGRYRRALRFLETIGFSLSEPFEFGPHGVLFRQYEARR